MDAFVVRRPKDQRPSANSGGSNPALLAFNNPNKYVVKTSRPQGALNLIPKAKGQQKLSELSGVVNLDRLETTVAKLQDETVSESEKIRLLRSLRHKKPATKIIRSSGIGKIVRALKDSPKESEPVRAEALKVYRTWKDLVEDRVEKKIKGKHIEVACDAATKQARATTVSLMKQALNKHRKVSPVVSTVLVEIERALFKSCNNLMDKSYRRGARKMVFALSSEPQNCPQFDEIQTFVDHHLTKK